jgi:hypothetical protein
MPGLLLGLIPAALGILSGHGIIMSFGILFTAAAGGDAIVLWTLRKENHDALVLDHRTRAGCCIVEAAADTTPSTVVEENTREK